MAKTEQKEISGDNFPQEWKLEDFDTAGPYQYLYGIRDPFEQSLAEEKMEKTAEELGFRSFRKRWTAYKKSRKGSLSSQSTENLSNVDDLPAEIRTGSWVLDDGGIRDKDGNIVCAHPIIPVAIVCDIDTGEERVRLQYKTEGQGSADLVREITVDSDTVFNARNIVRLASRGVSVASGKRAQMLVDYLRDVVDMNRKIIPVEMSVSHLGWTSNNRFAPYDSEIRFGGSDSLRGTYEAVHEKGQYEAWLEEAGRCRAYNPTARLVLDAAFASVLVEPLKCLPFFVHLWSPDSGVGKTVALMLAASVWGEPTVGGQYVKTFKSTSVGLELLAGTLNSLPMIIDELQLARDSYGRSRFSVYDLASGAGKNRGTKSLGLARGITWANCIITSGEMPLTDSGDGAGALNRVIDIECSAERPVIADGHRTAEIVRLNYGFAGRKFVDWIMQPGSMEEIRAAYESYNTALIRDTTANKQAASAALLLVGDMASSRLIFSDNHPLEPEDIVDFLKSNDEVSLADRGYQLICGWIAKNVSRFQTSTLQELKGDVYGRFSTDPEGVQWVFINKVAWIAACGEIGISSAALLSALREKDLIQPRGDGKTPYQYKVVGGVKVQCVVLKLLPGDENGADFYEIDDSEELPF